MGPGNGDQGAPASGLGGCVALRCQNGPGDSHQVCVFCFQTEEMPSRSRGYLPLEGHCWYHWQGGRIWGRATCHRCLLEDRDVC